MAPVAGGDAASSAAMAETAMGVGSRRRRGLVGCRGGIGNGVGRWLRRGLLGCHGAAPRDLLQVSPLRQQIFTWKSHKHKKKTSHQIF